MSELEKLLKEMQMEIENFKKQLAHVEFILSLEQDTQDELLNDFKKEGQDITSKEDLLKLKEFLTVNIEFHQFRFDLNKESDRGKALYATAHLEMKLKELLEKTLVPSKKRVVLKSFDYNGSLGTFSSKVAMSFLLGLIPPSIYDDLEIIRKIRNQFAHETGSLSFKAPKIYNSLIKLKNYRKDRPDWLAENPSLIFTRCITEINLFILIKIHDSSHIQECNEPNADITNKLREKAAKMNEDYKA